MQIVTSKQAANIFDLIDSLKDSLFKSNMEEYKKILQDNAILVSYFDESEVSSNNKEALLAYLDRTKEEIEKRPLVKLTLAISPEPPFLEKMYKWFLDTTGKQLLLDISIDQNILGGLLITYEGLYRDLSLKSKLDNYFKKFSSINELLRS
jgi:F0F1-type ATP synthase delta subunit